MNTEFLIFCHIHWSSVKNEPDKCKANFIVNRSFQGTFLLSSLWGFGEKTANFVIKSTVCSQTVKSISFSND